MLPFKLKKKGEIKMQVVEQSAELLAMTPNPLLLIERGGRVCYKSEDKLECHNLGCCSIDRQTGKRLPPCDDCMQRASKFVKGIIKRGHDSVLEHASATFLLITDRGMTHELVRHRICSFSQESTRFCNYGNKGGEISVIEPDLSEAREKYGKAQDLWRETMRKVEEAYLQMIEMKIAPQWARSVLPTCLKTEIATTANFREWRHMIGLRLNNKGGKAHPQIRALFRMILDELMQTEAAPIFEDIAKEAEEMED